MLEPVERRTVEGILSAMHHLAPRQAHAGPNLDKAPRSAASRDPGSTHALLSHASLPWTALPTPGNNSPASVYFPSASLIPCLCSGHRVEGQEGARVFWKQKGVP